MEKLIACCGLECSACEIRIATMNEGGERRAKTAGKIKEYCHLPEIAPEMVKCTGCRVDGKTMVYPEKCRIRKCVKANNFNSCAECEMLIDCEMVGKVHQHDPSALDNLRLLAKLIR